MNYFEKFLEKNIWAIFSAIVLVATVFLTSAAGSSAYASQQQLCGNGGTGYCMNDWNNGGSGNTIRMYYGNNSNEDFYNESLYRCDSNTRDTVTATAFGDATNCPFSNASLDNQFWGMPIFQIVYASHTNTCLGWPNVSDYTALTGCNNPNTGTGGGQGTVLVGEPTNPGIGSGCGGTGQAFVVSNYWTNKYNTAEYLLDSGNKGSTSVIGHDNSSATCWGGFSFTLP